MLIDTFFMTHEAPLLDKDTAVPQLQLFKLSFAKRSALSHFSTTTTL